MFIAYRGGHGTTFGYTMMPQIITRTACVATLHDYGRAPDTSSSLAVIHPVGAATDDNRECSMCSVNTAKVAFRRYRLAVSGFNYVEVSVAAPREPCYPTNWDMYDERSKMI